MSRDKENLDYMVINQICGSLPSYQDKSDLFSVKTTWPLYRHKRQLGALARTGILHSPDWLFLWVQEDSL